MVELLQADYRTAEQRYLQQLMEVAGRVGFLQAELGQARERILALEAPKPEPVPVEPSAEPVAAPETVVATVAGRERPEVLIGSLFTAGPIRLAAERRGRSRPDRSTGPIRRLALLAAPGD